MEDKHSLAEDVGPPRPDEIPGQGLADHVVGDVDDGGGGVLLADLLRVQGVVQVSGGWSRRGRLSGHVTGRASRRGAHLLISHGCVVQARAERSFSASVATLLFWNWAQAKLHSASPPAAMALQYTVSRRLGWMLGGCSTFQGHVHGGAQTPGGVRDGACTWVPVFAGVHPLLEPSAGQLLTFLQPRLASQAERVDLVVPGDKHGP